MRQLIKISLYMLLLFCFTISGSAYTAEKKKEEPKKETKAEREARLKREAERKAKAEPVMLEFWDNLKGNSLSALQGNKNYPDAADSWEFIDSLQYDFSNIKKDFGARIRGYIVPEKSLRYTFWISACGPCSMWLSTDDSPANLEQIISMKDGTRKWDFEQRADQKSKPIVLKDGKKYYFEVLMKIGNPRDKHLQVEWSAQKMKRVEFDDYALRRYDPKARKISEPQNFKLEKVSDQMALLTWDPPEKSGVLEYYELYRDRKKIAEVMGRSYIDVEVNPGKTHEYQLLATPIKGSKGDRSDKVEAKIPEDTGGTGKGLKMALYEGMEFDGRIGAKTDERVEFACSIKKRASTKLKDDEPFGIMWTGFIEPRYDEEYTFTCDIGTGKRRWNGDMFRLVIGNDVVIDKWHWKQNDQTGKIKLKAGEKYPITIMYVTKRTADALCKLYWESYSQPFMPISKRQLYAPEETKEDDLSIQISRTIETHVSPAWVEGKLGNNVDMVQAKIQCARSWKDVPVQMIKRWTGNGFFLGNDEQLGINLNRNFPANIKIRTAKLDSKRKDKVETEKIEDTTIKWTPLILNKYDAWETYYLKAGDRLLVQPDEKKDFPVLITAAHSEDKLPFFTREIKANDDIDIRFAKAGTYSIAVKSLDKNQNLELGIEIQVFDAKPEPIPCHYFYAATFPDNIAEKKVLNCSGEKKDKHCSVEPLDYRSLYTDRSSDGKLRLKPIRENGFYDYIVRLPDGRGITKGTVVPFRIDYKSRKDVRLIEELDDGTQIVCSELTMKPHVPGIKLDLMTIISGLTLSNSRTRMTITTNDLPVDELGEGRLNIVVIRDKAVANKYCNGWHAKFHNISISF